MPSKGTIKGLVSGSSKGGLLSAGTWSTQTLATITYSGSASSLKLSSSKGSCGVSGGAFSCGSGVTASTFTAVCFFDRDLSEPIHLFDRLLRDLRFC